MGKYGNSTLIVFFAALGIVWCSLASVAQALPDDPCNVAAQPTKTGDGGISITLPNKQTTRGWQRQGSNIEISVSSPKIAPKQSILVCFRWQLANPAEADDEKFKKYKSFVASGIVTSATPSDKPSGPLTITAAVPTAMPDEPDSPRHITHTKPVGVFELNNQYALADVRVLLYAEGGNDPVVDLTKPFGLIGSDVYCDMPLTGTTADSGIGELSTFKSWQPTGGQFEFTIKASKNIPTSAPVLVCFRWKLKEGDPRRFYASGPTHLVDKQPQVLKVAATVLDIPDPPDWWPKQKTFDRRIGDYAIPFIGLVPLADARVLVLDTDGTPIVDVVTKVGITNLLFAGIITVFTLFLSFYVLFHVSKQRLQQPPGHFSPLLCVITTRAGYASLSQFQIILWTFVVIASATYVMSLSGDLLAISTGTLVLLGISGTATVVSKAKSEASANNAPPPLDPATAEADASIAEDYALKIEAAAKLATGPEKAEADAAAKEARAVAEAAKAKAAAANAVVKAAKLRAAVAGSTNTAQATTDAMAAENDVQRLLKAAAIAAAEADRARRLRHPRWSDLVMEEIQGRELDVTRIQMLYFTLVTAVFVLMKVISGYEIPEIPEGFLILMGISNSVYVGSKFATNPNAK